MSYAKASLEFARAPFPYSGNLSTLHTELHKIFHMGILFMNMHVYKEVHNVLNLSLLFIFPDDSSLHQTMFFVQPVIQS
jgi:hypothetical protein